MHQTNCFLTLQIRVDQLNLQKKLISNSSFSVSQYDLPDDDTNMPEPLMADELAEINQSLDDIIILAYEIYATLSKTETSSDISSSSSLSSVDTLRKFVSSMCTHEPVPSDVTDVMSLLTLNISEHYLLENGLMRSNEEALTKNIGEVHLEIAVLEAVGHFTSSSCVRFGNVSNSAGTGGVSDISSCIFHLSQAFKYGNCAAAISFGRMYTDIHTDLLPNLHKYVVRDVMVARVFHIIAASRGSVAGLYYAAELFNAQHGKCLCKCVQT